MAEFKPEKTQKNIPRAPQKAVHGEAFICCAPMQRGKAL